MSRIVRIIGISLAGTVLLASTAAAAKPDRYSSNLEGFVLSGVCAFDIQLDILIDRSHEIDFYDRNGNLLRSQYNGSIWISMTNVETGQSIVLNVGGPASDVYNADGTITTTFLGLGLPLITNSDATKGNFQFVFSAGFENLLDTPVAAGVSWDICPLLAA
ncbi:MAG: hypothetical protein ABI864_03440 [Chloroflexota bacterium]